MPIGGAFAPIFGMLSRSRNGSAKNEGVSGQEFIRSRCIVNCNARLAERAASMGLALIRVLDGAGRAFRLNWEEVLDPDRAAAKSQRRNNQPDVS